MVLGEGLNFDSSALDWIYFNQKSGARLRHELSSRGLLLIIFDLVCGALHSGGKHPFSSNICRPSLVWPKTGKYKRKRGWNYHPESTIQHFHLQMGLWVIMRAKPNTLHNLFLKMQLWTSASKFQSLAQNGSELEFFLAILAFAGYSPKLNVTACIIICQIFVFESISDMTRVLSSYLMQRS